MKFRGRNTLMALAVALTLGACADSGPLAPQPVTAPDAGIDLSTYALITDSKAPADTRLRQDTSTTAEDTDYAIGQPALVPQNMEFATSRTTKLRGRPITAPNRYILILAAGSKAMRSGYTLAAGSRAPVAPSPILRAMLRSDYLLAMP